MLNLYLIRHAESEDNKSGLISGSSLIVPLSKNGIEQAGLLGKRLVKEGISFERVYSSPAQRAKQTAELVLNAMGISIDDIVVRDEFRELSQGDIEGQPLSFWTPERLERIDENPLDFKAPNGDSKRDVIERFYGWIVSNLVPNYESLGNVAIFTHSLAIKCVIAEMLKATAYTADRISIGNASISRLTYTKRGWFLNKLNDTSHTL